MVQEYKMYLYSRTDFGDAAAWGQKLPMRLHRPIFHLHFLPLKLVHQHKHDAGKKIPFFPPHLTFIPLIVRASYFTPNAHSPPLPLTIPMRGLPAL
jgi:hypothetical protein